MKEKQDPIKWYRTPILKSTLKELTRRSSWRGLVQSVSILLIYGGFVFLCVYFFTRRMWFPMAGVCYAHSLFHNFVGMEASVHELTHGTPFKSKWLNEIFFHLFCFLTWNNGIHFRPSHMKHHQLTVHKGRDKEVVLEPLNYTWLDFISWFTFDVKHFAMYMFPTVAHVFGNADADFFHWDPLFPEGDKRRKQMCNYARFLFFGHLILAGIFIYFGLWPLIIIVTFGYYIATFPSRGCVILQHGGLCPNFPDWRVSCRTVIMGPVLGYFYWHMNYHLEHHMYAAVPFFNLRKLHKLIAHDTPEPLKGFWAGLKEVFAIQRKQKADSAYCQVPEFPDSAAPPEKASY